MKRSFLTTPITAGLLALLVSVAYAKQTQTTIAIQKPVAPAVSPAPFDLRTAPPRVTSAKKARKQLTSISALEPGIKLNIWYATSDNFMKRPLYKLPRAYLQKHAAEGVVRAHRKLAKDGYGIMVFDAYRPWSVSVQFWDAVTQEQREKGFVADPKQGSRHNRACAVDISLYELSTGKEVAMPSAVDEMSDRAAADYAGGTADQRARRDLLRTAMESEGFTVLPHEWWHFDCVGFEKYPIMDVPFEKLEK
jgi:zinc D-Ala-D-Ala dipeptidase